MHPTTQGHRVISLALDWRKVMPAGQMMYWHPALYPQGNKALISPKKTSVSLEGGLLAMVSARMRGANAGPIHAQH